jgi:Homeodomain-like domain
MHVEGMSQAAIARVIGVSVSTIRRWLDRAAVFSREFNERHVRDLAAVELQADELRTYTTSKQRVRWVHASMSVWSRLWTSLHVGRRTYRDTLLHFRALRSRCSLYHLPPFLVTDAFKYNENAIKRTFGNWLIYVQVEKTYSGNRIRRKRERLVVGPQHRLDMAMARSEDSRKTNTAYIERLNLTIRRSLAALQRKTCAQARSTKTLRSRLEVLRCHYNFIRPHGSLRFGKQTRTPAQQAGIASRQLKWRDVFLGSKRSPSHTLPAWRVPHGTELGADFRRAFYA